MQLKLDAIKKYCNKNKDFALTKASKLVGLISFGLFVYFKCTIITRIWEIGQPKVDSYHFFIKLKIM